LFNDPNCDIRVWVEDGAGRRVRIGTVDVTFPNGGEPQFSSSHGNLWGSDVATVSAKFMDLYRGQGRNLSRTMGYAPGPLFV
jgi:hypothetical protein